MFMNAMVGGIRLRFYVIRLVVYALVAVVGLHSVAMAQSWKVGDKLPKFSAKGSDGKTYTLQGLTKKGPAVIYFIMNGCPINDHAITYYKRIAVAYKKAKVPFIGVIDSDAKGFKAWNEVFKVPFTVLLDKEHKIISSWKVLKSPWVIVADKNQKVMKEWNGYSQPAFKELSKIIAKYSGVKEKTIDFTGAPSKLRPG